MKNPIPLILLLGFTLVRVASASIYADDFPAALPNYAYGGWQGPFGDGTAGRLFPSADGTGIYMDATYNGYVWALRSSPEFSDADMTVRFVLPNRDNTEADWFGLWMLAHNPTTPPGGSCTSNCPFVVPESGLWLQFRVGFNQLVVSRFAGGVSVSSTVVPLPFVALNQPHDARAVYQSGSLIVYLDDVQLLSWPAPNVPAGQVGFEVYRTDMIVDATNIVAGPAPPTLAAIANMTVAPGATADQGISATDPDADAITFTSSSPSFMTLTQDAQVGTTRTGNIHLAPPLGTSGSFQASVTATAQDGFDDQTFSITVSNNEAPVLSQPANMFVPAGQTADQAITGTDPNGDPLIFAKVSGPAFMFVNTTNPGSGTGSGNIHLAPTVSDFGSYLASVSVTDGTFTDSKSFTITVTDCHSAPVLAQPANMTVAEGATADQVITATDACGDALTFTKVSGPLFMTVTTVNAATGNIHLAPGFSDQGSFTATVRASNGSLNNDKSFTITIAATNRSPILAQPANMGAREGTTADQAIVGSDPDGNALTFSKVTGPFFVTVTTTNATSGNIHIAPPFGSAGAYPASVQASDGTLSDSKSFTITVLLASNRCPAANPGGPYSGIAGVPVNFDGTRSSDPDGDVLAYAWDFDASDGVGADAVGSTTSHAYVSGGAFVVTLAVSDGVCSNSATTSASILSACPAAVFNGYDVIRLGSGKPFWFAYVQPASGCYTDTDVIITSFVLKYAGRQIPAQVTKTSIGGDKNGDGIQEIKVSWSKDNLRALFTGTGLANGDNLVTVTLEASLVTGGTLQGTTQVHVFNNGSFTTATVSPNPLNPEATLTFTTAHPGFAKVEMFDIGGRLVRTILDERSLAAGAHEVKIEGRGARGETLASGIYFIRGVSSEGEFTRTVAILK